MTNNKVRSSNFELLRIICIVMVLILHYLNGSMGGALDNVSIGSLNYYLMNIIDALSIIAVNTFILITGYFSISKEKVKLNKAINLGLVLIGYSIIFYIASIVLGSAEFSVRELIKSLNPFTIGSRWFVNCYIILYLLSPFLNKMIKALNKNQFIQLISILVISFSVIPTLIHGLQYNDSGLGVVSFISLYCIGAYIRLYVSKCKSKLFYLGIYIGSSICTFIILLTPSRGYAWNYNLIFNIISAVALFMYFSQISVSSKLINYLATFTFSIYIIHTDPRITNVLYQEIFKCNQFWNSKWFIVHLIVTIGCMYFGCIAIDTCRRIILKPISGKISILDDVEIG